MPGRETVSAGGRATVVYSLRRHAMIFTPHQLPPLPAGKVYELWLIGPPVVRPAGLLPTGPGASAPILASGVVRGDEVGLTIEPAAVPRADHAADPGYPAAGLTRKRILYSTNPPRCWRRKQH